MIWLFIVFGLGIFVSSVTKLNRTSRNGSYDSLTGTHMFEGPVNHKYKL